MKLTRRNRAAAGIAAALLAMTPAVALANKTGNTLLGAGIGALGGALISDGDTWGTIGGAVAGGVIGNVASKDKHDRWDRRDEHRWKRDHGERDRRYDRRR